MEDSRWLFTLNYLKLDALRRAVATNDDSIGRIGEGKILYTTIEEAILDSEGGKAHRYRAAANWCAAKLKGEEFQILSKGKKQELLLKKWVEECPVQDCSLRSLFNNGPFNMNKLLVYEGDAGPAAGGDAASGRHPLPAAAESPRRRRRPAAAAAAESPRRPLKLKAGRTGRLWPRSSSNTVGC
jgi:hypothetical protein